MTEQEIQKYLYRYCIGKKHLLSIPNNVSLLGWEADFISITQSKLIHEFEIKVNKYDYLREIRAAQNPLSSEAKNYKHAIISGKKTYPTHLRNIRKPAYFWYVVPYGLETPDLPSYAGLMKVIDPENPFVVVKKNAKRLCNDKVTEHDFRKISVSLYHKYWNLRNNK